MKPWNAIDNKEKTMLNCVNEACKYTREKCLVNLQLERENFGKQSSHLYKKEAEAMLVL